AWADGNRNEPPDVDLLNGQAQDNRASGGDFCSVISDTAFGTDKFTSTLDPVLVNGWGVRTGDWQYGVSVQQEVLPRVSVEVGYLRRWLVNFIATDNLNQSAGQYDTFFISAPVDSRLPTGGGYAVAGPLYNVNPSVAS